MYPAGVIIEEASCPLGCPANDETVLTGRDRLHNLPGEFRMVKCRTCGLMRTSPRPTAETIGVYYPEDYAPHQEISTPVRSTPKPLWRRVGRVVYNALPFHTENIPDIPPGRMLEIGCGSGAFLRGMMEKGWVAEGVEFSPQAAERARALGCSVYAGPLETAPGPAEPYDLIVGWMVLEHLHNPVAALRQLRRRLKPGGWLVLSLPDAGALEFRIFKDAWYALQLPTHLFHFTPETLAMVLERGGWQLKKLYHQRNLGNLAASAGYVMRDSRPESVLAEALIRFPERPGIWKTALFPVSFILSIFGQTGRMTAWAQLSDEGI